MSLFLGKIHYWLYNKIQWFESLEEEMIQSVKGQDYDMSALVKHIHSQYGAPTGNRSLEEIINPSNIHGSLQERIESAEMRHAALITELLKWNPSHKIILMEIFMKQGAAAAHEYGGSADTPEEIFHALNDFILEGMPCDRVNETVVNNQNEFSWDTTLCLHEPHWKKVGGNVKHFHDLREAWVKAFVSAINSDFRYEKSEDGVNHIIHA